MVIKITKETLAQWKERFDNLSTIRPCERCNIPKDVEERIFVMGNSVCLDCASILKEKLDEQHKEFEDKIKEIAEQ